MLKFLGPLGALGLLTLVVFVSVLNDFQKVSINLGFVTFYRVPITVLAVVGFVLGMLLMILVGVESDLKIRSILRERFRDESREEDESVKKKSGELH